MLEQEENKVRMVMLGYTVSFLPTSWVQYGSTAFLDNWKPKQAILFMGYDASFLLRVGDDGKLYWKSNTGTSQSNKNLYGQYEWSML